jgi:hypothetical protein
VACVRAFVRVMTRKSVVGNFDLSTPHQLYPPPTYNTSFNSFRTL